LTKLGFDQICVKMGVTKLVDHLTKLGFDQISLKEGVTKLGGQIGVKRVSPNWVTRLVWKGV
jgi:hypothetical protein